MEEPTAVAHSRGAYIPGRGAMENVVGEHAAGVRRAIDRDDMHAGAYAAPAREVGPQLAPRALEAAHAAFAEGGRAHAAGGLVGEGIACAVRRIARVMRPVARKRARPHVVHGRAVSDGALSIAREQQGSEVAIDPN